MSKTKRIVLAGLAWIISHFALHILTDLPDGGIALTNLFVAGAVYFVVGKDNNRTIR